MDDQRFVALLVHVPHELRVRVRVEAAAREMTITRFVTRALEAAVGAAPSKGGENG